MTYIAKPKFHHPGLPKSELGCTQRDYEGKISALCAGCGHDSITASIIEACYELSIEPHRVAKISGIGCSSKTPDYFLGNSHGFNSVHGRMPSVLTGAALANRDLIYLGVSGDGDSASIGLGQFAHALRRGVDMVYVVENNGVYGLTKGQFSATADSGPGHLEEVTQHDGSVLRLRKLAPDYDPHDRVAALAYLQERHAAGEIVTGLLYMDPEPRDLHDQLGTVDTPLNRLSEAELCPGSAGLEAFNAARR